MKHRSILVLLFSFLLLSQTAIAAHDIEHQAFDHTELCAAFVTADQSADCDLPIVSVPFPAVVDSDFSLIPIGIFSVRLSTYPSRAPPLA